MQINEKIRLLREYKHWTQEELAEKLGMSNTGYAKIERGQSNINLEKLTKIADIFSIPPSQLLSDNNQFLIDNILQPNEDTKDVYPENTATNIVQSPEYEKYQLELKYLNKLLEHKEKLLEQKERLLVQKNNEIKLLKK